MEIGTVNTFAEYSENYHWGCIILECGLVQNEIMPYIGASPDWLILCSCCGKACIEMKYPCSINYTKPNEHDIK